MVEGCGPMATTCGVTGMPGRTRCRPFTTMVSPGARPSRTTRRPSTTGPSFTGRYSTLLCESTASTYLTLWSVLTALIDEECVVSFTAHQLHAREHAGRKAPVVIVEASAGADRACCGIQLVVEEHHDTTVGAVLLIGETDPYRILGVAGAGTQTRAREGSVLEVHLLVALELDVDGIDRHQPREQRLIRGHQISRGDLRAADEPGDRGVDLRAGQIELGGVDCRIRGLDARCRLLGARNSRFEFLLGDGTSLK